MTETFHEKRSEPRTIVNKYYSVEIRLKKVFLRYQFKVRDMSAHGMCLMVKKGSVFLDYVAVNEVIDMKYYLNASPRNFERWETRIAHISEDPQGRQEDHCFVGLELLRKIDRDGEEPDDLPADPES